MSNSLRALRVTRGLSQEELARSAGVSRRAYAAIEGGHSIPATDTALRLAAALRTTVETLFSLEARQETVVEAELPEGAGAAAPDPRVQVARIGDRLIARPLADRSGTQHSLAFADGTLVRASAGERTTQVRLLDPDELNMPTVVVTGCDPSLTLLRDVLLQRGVRLLSFEHGSLDSLRELGRGRAHIAGCHLEDAETGTFNAPWVRRLLPFSCTLVRFAIWREGLILQPGNPKRVSGVGDLSRRDVRIVNRQTGAGSRSLLERLLVEHDIPPEQIQGYDREVHGHLTLAEAVATGFADAGIGIEAAARAYGLEFIPVHEEPYDLAIPTHFLDEPSVQAFLDALRKPGIQRRLSALGGYDTSETGLPMSTVGP